MKRILLIMALACFSSSVFAQTVAGRLSQAYQAFVADPQMANAAVSIYVADAATGKMVFERNSRMGMLPASTLKVVTAATAYDLLGPGFRYRTGFSVWRYSDTLDGIAYQFSNLVITPSGDPTLGSWRWTSTGESRVVQRVISSLAGRVHEINDVQVYAPAWHGESIPDGWTWQDIGNYYGAGAHALNWRENQYDLMLRSGRDTGSRVEVVETVPVLYGISPVSLATAAPRGTGDRTYIYYSLDHHSDPGFTVYLRGTIPAGESRFRVSGSFPEPGKQFVSTLADALARSGQVTAIVPNQKSQEYQGAPALENIHTEVSPSLDSIVYFFLTKSINLYGEALLRTLGLYGKGVASTQAGVEVLHEHWKKRGISTAELRVGDGSGLSLQNRVTTRAQVQVLQYARKQPWFSSYYQGFPLFNGMRMKSGTLTGTKGFCGYHRAADGKEYIFSFIVNNYTGNAASLVQKMYRVLDAMK